MADVDHELGALRFIVDSPLSSKVAMFNKKVDQHEQAQAVNPFSQEVGVVAQKLLRPVISKEEYGKPIAGSLTEMRGQKASLHVWREILDMCRIIDDEGTPNPDNPELKAILFGDLFHIYTHISDKVVGLLLRARKHKLVDFEGEMLFQRRDDDVPIYLLKSIVELRQMIREKEGIISRGSSPSPQPTTVLMDIKSRSVSPASKSSDNTDKSRSASPKPPPPQITQTASAEVSSEQNGKADSMPQPTIILTDNSTTE